MFGRKVEVYLNTVIYIEHLTFTLEDANDLNIVCLYVLVSALLQRFKEDKDSVETQVRKF